MLVLLTDLDAPPGGAVRPYLGQPPHFIWLGVCLGSSLVGKHHLSGPIRPRSAPAPLTSRIVRSYNHDIGTLADDATIRVPSVWRAARLVVVPPPGSHGREGGGWWVGPRALRPSGERTPSPPPAPSTPPFMDCLWGGGWFTPTQALS